MYGCPPPCAVADSNGEDREKKEEAGHAKANFVDRRVANQSFAVLPCIQLLTYLSVEWDLNDKIRSTKYHKRIVMEFMFMFFQYMATE